MGALDEVIARLRRVKFARTSSHQRSRVALMQEFLRRSALWSEALQCPERWPFFDIALAAHADQPGAASIDVQSDLELGRLPALVRESIVAMLRWARNPVALAGLPDPYEPLLWFYERGGVFTVENRIVDVDSVGVYIHDRAPYLTLNVFAELSVAALDALDGPAASTSPRSKPRSPMIDNSAGIPVTWAQLLDPQRNYLEVFEYRLEDLRQRGPGATARGELRTLFLNSGENLAGIAAIAGAEHCAKIVAEVAPGFPSVVALLGPAPYEHQAVEAEEYLRFANASLCCGGPPLPLELDEANWVAMLIAAKPPPEKDLVELGLLSCALGLTGQVPGLFGRKAEPFEPGATFGFDVPAFVMHLAAAHDAGAGFDAIKDAWDSFVRTFPRKLSARSLKWSNLLTAARVVYATLAAQPIGATARLLCEYTHCLAREAPA